MPSPTGLLTGGYVADDTAAQLEAIVAKRGAYIRESSQEQGEGFSPGAQRKRIYEWAEENEIEIIGEYCDLHSAWSKSDARPEFQRLMSDAAKGMSGWASMSGCLLRIPDLGSAWGGAHVHQARAACRALECMAHSQDGADDRNVSARRLPRTRLCGVHMSAGGHRDDHHFPSAEPATLLVRAAVVMVTIVTPVLASAIPDLACRANHGTNEIAAHRCPYESYSFALQPVQLVLPQRGDRIGPLSEFTTKIDGDLYRGLPGLPMDLGQQISLGLISALGLVWLLWAVVGAAVGRIPRNPLETQAGTATLLSILRPFWAVPTTAKRMNSLRLCEF
jgi:Resolvase, N terminal domain